MPGLSHSQTEHGIGGKSNLKHFLQTITLTAMPLIQETDFRDSAADTQVACANINPRGSELLHQWRAHCFSSEYLDTVPAES